jgi:hypothetical protein
MPAPLTVQLIALYVSKRRAGSRQVTVRLPHDRLIVYLGSDWVCQLPRAHGSGSHGPRACAPSPGFCSIAATSVTAITHSGPSGWVARMMSFAWLRFSA